MIGFNYPNSNYLRGGYGVRTPSRHDHSYYNGGGYGPRAYYGPGPAGVAAGIAAGTAAAIAGAPYYDSYGYYDGPRLLSRAGLATATKRPQGRFFVGRAVPNAVRRDCSASGLAWEEGRMVRVHHPMS